MADLNDPSSFSIAGPHGQLAYHRVKGDVNRPGVVWLGGFRSDMTGTKAQHLSTWAQTTDRSFLRFDYSGHGASEGRFEAGCLSDWIEDAIFMLTELTDGPQILVGSSMGAWIATHVALQKRRRVAGIVFIAPAPDFTEKLMWPTFDAATKKKLRENGRIEEASDYCDNPTILTQKLFEDGRQNLVMTGEIEIDCPIIILQGMADPDVPYQHALAFAEYLTSTNLQILMSKSGDHRLSSPSDLDRLTQAVESVSISHKHSNGIA